MGRGQGRPVKTRGPAHGQGGRSRVVVVAVVHLISWGAVRVGPSKHVGGLVGWVEWPIKEPTCHGPRPGRVHQIFKCSPPGLAQPIKFSNSSARPGPTHHIKNNLGPVRPGLSQFQYRPGPVRPGPSPMTSSDFLSCFYANPPKTIRKGISFFFTILMNL